MLALQLVKLSKRFSQGAALTQLTLEVEQSSRLAIVGRSGAGKTTLLRIIAGLEAAEHGSVLIHGRDVTTAPANVRGLAMVTQDYALYPHLTVKQNLSAALNSLGLGSGESSARIEEALQWFAISELAARFPSQISGGQAQRVAVAKAVVRRPRILLLDEPFSQLDCTLRTEFRGLIKELVDCYAMTMVLVTHDALDALSLSTHIAVLEEGQLRQYDTAQTVYDQPKTRACAELLSPAGFNWLTLAMLEASSSPPNVLNVRDALCHGRAVGFRPENLILEGCNVAPSQDLLWLKAKLVAMQPVGSNVLTTLASEGQQFQSLQPHTPFAQALQIGSYVVCSVPMDRLIVVEK
jgi:ABC-type sugar transport system ATPase subunit